MPILTETKNNSYVTVLMVLGTKLGRCRWRWDHANAAVDSEPTNDRL